MEALIAATIAVLTAGGVWLLLRSRTFAVVLGVMLLSYAVNLFLLAMGRLNLDSPPIVRPGVREYADPLTQALVLTAIVIGFGMAAFTLVLSLSARLATGTDHVDGLEPPADDRGVPETESGAPA